MWLRSLLKLHVHNTTKTSEIAQRLVYDAVPYKTITVNDVGDQTEAGQGNILQYKRDNKVSPVSFVFHHDLTSPIQYDLSVSSQSVSWLLSDGRPVSVKTANDPPRDKQSLLASYHDSWRSNFP